MKNISDQIRDYVRANYVEPARLSLQGRFTVRCGTVETQMGMSNRTAQVCSALKSPRLFLDPNHLRIVGTSGPQSGMGRNTEYTYEFQESGPTATVPKAPVTESIYTKLRQMEGLLKDVYKELGGAERAIREEREGYSR